MKALILGAGKVGLGIAQHFVDQGTEVTLVDKSHQVVNYVKHFTDLPIVLGDAFDTDYLASLFQDAPTHIVATLSNDEQNLVACKIVGNTFSASEKIARIRSQVFTKNDVVKLFIKNSFGVDAIIQPEIEVANAITNIVKINNSLEVMNTSNVVVVSIKCKHNTEVLNTEMRLFESVTDLLFKVVAIVRNGEFFFASSEDVLLPNDVAYVAMSKSQIADVLRLFGYEQECKQNILIIGGGNIGENVIKNLQSQCPNIFITLIEKSREKANEIVQKYPKLMVMFGDVQNTKILRDASTNIDTAIVATNDDKTNVITALFLKENNIQRTLTLNNNKEYEQLFNANSLNLLINPNVVTVNNIVRQSRDLNIFETSESFRKSLCVIEVTVAENCPNINNGLNEICEKNHVMPVFVVRNDNLLMLRKDYKVTCGDHIIIVITNDRFNKIEAFFRDDFN